MGTNAAVTPVGQSSSRSHYHHRDLSGQHTENVCHHLFLFVVTVRILLRLGDCQTCQELLWYFCKRRTCEPGDPPSHLHRTCQNLELHPHQR